MADPILHETDMTPLYGNKEGQEYARISRAMPAIMYAKKKGGRKDFERHLRNWLVNIADDDFNKTSSPQRVVIDALRDPDLLQRMWEFTGTPDGGEDKGELGALLKGDGMEGLVQEVAGAEIDPMFSPFSATSPAGAEEEKQAMMVWADAQKWLFGEGTTSVVRMLRTVQEPFESAAEVVFQVLRRQKTEMEAQGHKPSATAFLAQDGPIPALVESVFEIGEAAGMPGFDDPEQFSAAIMNTYKKAGEYLLEQGDDFAVTEASELVLESLGAMEGVPQRKPVAAAVEEGL